MTPARAVADAPRRTGPPPGASIPAVFREQARRYPRATALVHGDRALSYARLDRASDALAHRLREAGVAPGDLVPVVVPRSAELVVALLAVLKRGAAYAALDPAWPRPHLHRLIRRLGARAVVSDDEGGWPQPVVVPAVTVDATRAGRDPRPADVTGDRPAMVFFTSGTTGTPKAVVSPHRATLRLLDDEVLARPGPGGAMPLAAPSPWDAFAFELWSMLLTGGTSVITEGPYLMPDTLRSAVRRHGVDTVWLTATLFNLFVDEDPASFAGLRQVLTGGERLSPHHVRAFLTAHPETELVNGYGPVESTVFATVHRVRAADTERPGGIPIGRPVAGTDVHVLDGDRPCVPGASGEICIGGDGLAVGYLGEPERTGTAFVTVDLGGHARRLYRTGDRGHRCAEGLLHFGGRTDRQVKLRGHRVELGHVEALAGRIPGVARAVAVAVTDPDGACREFVLFCTAVAGGGVTPEQVRTELSRRAPRHLVPDRVERVDSIPVTANGKVDHAALLKSLGARPPGQGSSPDPSDGRADEVQAAVAAAFAEVLGVRRISPDDSFFRLGGTSLDAGRVSVRLSRRLGVPVPVSRVVAHPTARELGSWLRGPGTAVDRADRTGTGAEAAGPEVVPLEHMQAAWCFMHQLTPQDLSPLCPMVWEIEGRLDIGALEAALVDTEHRHDALRAAYLVRDGAPVAVVAPVTGSVPLHRLGPEDAPGERRGARHDRDRLLRHLLGRPLAIERGEVWRHAVLRSGERTLLGVVVHHVAFDGRSQNVLARDLSTAYAARVRGHAPHFGSPAPPLRRVSAELRRQRGRLAAGPQRRFWAGELADLPDLAVPGRPGTARAAGADPLAFTVSAGDLALCDRVAGEVGGTRFTVLLATFAHALHQVTGQDAFGMGVPVAKRGSDVLDRAVTCLVDTVCLPLRGLSAANGPAALAGSVHRACRRAFAAQDVPFSEVVRIANPPRGARHPLFQVMFALQDAAPPALRLAGCTTRFHRASAPRAVAELVAEVWPLEDGAAAVELSRQPEAVGPSFAREVCSAYREGLRQLADPAHRAGRGGAR
ncbi:amino acid adenylation domain-containing protein [Streptomyces sediminimaris]|uniref:amino acid adenylation domain-containing protein n=1 Tax=Streptomyces sediminimaris TaxID=3383721 RepID=UPI00399BDBBF